MKQPKDYEEYTPETFDDWLREGYKQLTFAEKIAYHIQDNYILAIGLGLVVGYVAGATFGKFW